MKKRSYRSDGGESRSRRRWLWAGLAGVLVGATAGLSIKDRPPAPAATPPEKRELAPPDRAALAQFVERYFTTWSAKDIDSYGGCFHPTARIWFETSSSMALPEFLESQRRAHAMSPVPLTERALSWDGQIHNNLAHVQVHWELLRGQAAERGYDFFTLALSEGQWQIVALVFNAEEK